MGTCQDSCRGGSKENELNIEKSAYERAINEKVLNARGIEDLEEAFLNSLKNVEYYDQSVKVTSE